MENDNFISMSNSKPISPSLITMTTEVLPDMVEKETQWEDFLVNKKKGKAKKYDPKRKSIKSSEAQEESSMKKSKKKKGEMSKSFGKGITVHMLTIQTGEDIIEKIMSFTQNSSRGTCILSANGAVCNVKIQRLGFNDRALTFKDAYEIISLKGTMVITESGGVRSETGGWQISIGGVDGIVFGGSLPGSLIAASSVQVILGSFCPSLMKDNESESVIFTPIPNALGSASKGQVQQPKMKDPCPNLNLEGEETGSELTP